MRFLEHSRKIDGCGACPPVGAGRGGRAASSGAEHECRCWHRGCARSQHCRDPSRRGACVRARRRASHTVLTQPPLPPLFFFRVRAGCRAGAVEDGVGPHLGSATRAGSTARAHLQPCQDGHAVGHVPDAVLEDCVRHAGALGESAHGLDVLVRGPPTHTTHSHTHMRHTHILHAHVLHAHTCAGCCTRVADHPPPGPTRCRRWT
jgi:hypothetical protein